jgi:hypothetical protein
VGLAIPAQAGDGRVQLLKGQGSDATYDLMQNLDKAFNNSAGCNTVPGVGNSPDNSTCVNNGPVTTENNDHDIAASFFPVGSSNGIRILTNFGLPNTTKIDFARSSRARRGSDNANLRFVAYAQDGVTFVNFRNNGGDSGSPANAVTNLSLAQLNDIWTDCQATNWNQIGGGNSPIIVWTGQDGSGTVGTWETIVGASAGGTKACIPAQYKDNNLTNGERVIFENDSSPIRTCTTYAGGSCAAAADTLSSIFFVSFGAWNASPSGAFGKDSGSDLGDIGGVAVNETTIRNGTFPGKRNVYNVYRRSFGTNDITAESYDYMSEEGWICKPNSTHSNNPKTGVNYGTEIHNAIQNTGFFDIDEAAIDAGDPGNPFIIQSKCRIS